MQILQRERLRMSSICFWKVARSGTSLPAMVGGRGWIGVEMFSRDSSRPILGFEQGDSRQEPAVKV